MIRKIKYILIVVCVAMSFTGIGLYFSLRTDTLKSDTTITLKDNAVKTLNEFFAEENGTLLGKGVKTIKIAYTMLESAGNELQGAETTFYIDLKTERNTGK